MTSKHAHSTRLMVAVGVSTALMWLCFASPDSAAHDVCPDYSEYKSVLDEGHATVESGRSLLGRREVRDPSRDMYHRPFRDRYEGHKNPKLQQYIDTACGVENNQDVTNAIRWWNAIAVEAQKRDFEPENKFLLALVESRLADLTLIDSYRDVIDDFSEPPYLEWREAARARYFSVLDAKASFLRDKGVVSWDAMIQAHEQFDKPSPELNSDKSLPLYQGTPPHRSVSMSMGDIFFGHQTSSRELSVPLLSQPLQNRLQKILSESIYSDKGNSKDLPPKHQAAKSQAYKLYRSAVEKRKLLPDKGRSTFCVFDLIKISIIEKADGQEAKRENSLAEATKLFVALPITPPEYMRDDYNAANLQSSKIVYLLLTSELVSYGARHSRNLKQVEARLETDFPRRWAPTAMKCYADANDRDNLLRVFREFGADVLSPDAPKNRAVSERMKVADALLTVEAIDESNTFISAWMTKLPDDQIGRAIQCEAIGEVNLKQGRSEAALKSFEETLKILSSIKAVDEYVAKSQREICWKVLTKTKSLKSSEGSKAVSSHADDLFKLANHRLMQFDCIALSKQLAETGERLERMGQYETAGKVYAASADIKVKNLGAYDQESVRQQVNTARVLMSTGKLEEAESMLSNAIKGMRRSSGFDSSELRSALETRADVLSRLNRTREADLVYEELRTMK